jgi:hypothetical protein
VEVGRFGAAKTAAAKVGAPAPSASASSAPAAAIPDIAPGLQSIGAQVKALFDAAATVDGAYRNNYEKVLAADIAKIEKEKVANNLVRAAHALCVCVRVRHSIHLTSPSSPAGPDARKERGRQLCQGRAA